MSKFTKESLYYAAFFAVSLIVWAILGWAAPAVFSSFGLGMTATAFIVNRKLDREGF